MLYKRYIPVVTLIGTKGELRPLFIIWDHGVKFPIDKILEVRNCASLVGGCGILYRCRIQGKERNLFYEKNRWFIESHQP
ncbi:MAG: hypothetical protein RR863_03285 [Erysipelotrichaceae bacterium]